jgi:hypothetical protein
MSSWHGSANLNLSESVGLSGGRCSSSVRWRTSLASYLCCWAVAISWLLTVRWFSDVSLEWSLTDWYQYNWHTSDPWSFDTHEEKTLHLIRHPSCTIPLIGLQTPSKPRCAADSRSSNIQINELFFCQIAHAVSRVLSNSTLSLTVYCDQNVWFLTLLPHACWYRISMAFSDVNSQGLPE